MYSGTSPASGSAFETFERDLRAHILVELPHKPEAHADLAGLATPSLVARFLNWRNRFIPKRPRQVYRSARLRRHTLPSSQVADLELLITKIEAGGDLTPHLSERVEDGFERDSRTALARRRDLDLMLADWQLHHLHISNAIGTNGCVTRDRPLLFAAFRPDEAYLVGIYGHREWTRESICHTLIDEWPKSSFVRLLPGVLGFETARSEADRKLLRGAGISSSSIEYKGKCYFIGVGGLTSAGTALIATRQANYILASLRILSDHIAENPNSINEAFRRVGKAPPETPDLHAELLLDGQCVIRERTTGMIFYLPPPR